MKLLWSKAVAASLATLVSVSAHGAVTYGQASIEQLKAYAMRGDVVAMGLVGMRYDNGIGVRENNTEAVRWYRLAAERGHVKSQYNLALMYDNGEGVREDNRLALIWYRIAGEHGDLAAQANVGAMYDHGEGTPVDKAQAVKWFKMAADRGDAASQYNLGVMYFKGEGVERDVNTALKWYRKAASKGDIDAHKALTQLSSAGFVVTAADNNSQLGIPSPVAASVTRLTVPRLSPTSTLTVSKTSDSKSDVASSEKPAAKSSKVREARVFDPPSNIRNEPDGKKVICSIEEKKTLEVSGSGEWLSTTICGKKGYIHRNQLRFL